MSSRPIPVRADLTAIALAWRPRDVDLIADAVLPRVVLLSNRHHLRHGAAVAEARSVARRYCDSLRRTFTT